MNRPIACSGFAAMFVIVALAGCGGARDVWRAGGVELVLDADTTGLSPALSDSVRLQTVRQLTARLGDAHVEGAEVALARDGSLHVRVPGEPDVPKLARLIGTRGVLRFMPLLPPDSARAVYAALDRLCARDSAGGKVPPGVYVNEDGGVLVSQVPLVAGVLRSEPPAGFLPAGARVRWGRATMSANRAVTMRGLYALDGEPGLGPDAIERAIAAKGLDSAEPKHWGIALKMTPEGRETFARLTASHIGRQIAIVLDDEVLSAPIVRERIPSGDAQITGAFDEETARDLAIALSGHALGVPLRMRESHRIPPAR